MKRIYTSLLVAIIALLGLPTTTWAADPDLENDYTLVKSVSFGDAEAVNIAASGTCAHTAWETGNKKQQALTVLTAPEDAAGWIAMQGWTADGKGKGWWNRPSNSLYCVNAQRSAAVFGDDLTTGWLVVFECKAQANAGLTLTNGDGNPDGTFTYTTSEDGKKYFCTITAESNAYVGFCGVKNSQGILKISVYKPNNAAVPSTYTVKYLDMDGNKLKDDVVYNSVVGASISLTAADKANITVDDETYIYDNDDAEGKTVTENGGTTITVKFHKAKNLNYFVYETCNDGVSVRMTTGQSYETASVTVPYRAYNVYDGQLYKKGQTNKEFNHKFTLTRDNQVEEIAYTAVDGKNNVVFLSEGEDIEGMTKCTTNNAGIRSSNSAAAFAPADVAVTELSAGKYQLYGIFYDAQKTAMSDWAFKAGAIKIGTIHNETTNYFEAGAIDFAIGKETIIKIAQGGNQSIGVDALYIIKTGDVTPEEADALNAQAQAAEDLAAAIAEAKAIETEGKEGVEALQTAIATAEAALAVVNATTESLTAAKNALAEAVAAFKEANKPAFDPATAIVNAGFNPEADPLGWDKVTSAQFFDLGMGLIGTYQVRGEHPAATVDETHLATEFAAGLECRWSTNYAAFTQTTAELPAGAYKLTFDVENTNATTTKANYENRFNVTVGETTYADESTEWMNGKSAWTTHTIAFTLTEASPITISLGYGTGSNNFGVGNTPALFVSHLTLGTFDPLADAKAKLQDEITAAEALVENAAFADGKEDLNSAIAAAKKALAEATTAEEFSTAIETLKAAEAAFVKAQAVAANAALVAGASIDNPVSAPFVVNGTLDENTNGWTATGGFQNRGTATNQQGDFTGKFWENWDPNAKVNKMYQVIENIPNGVYKLKIAAFVNTLADPNESQFVFANEDKVFLTTGAPTFYEVYTMVENNTLEVGLEQTTATANWMGIDNITLLYFGAEGTVEDAKMAAPKNDWKIAKAAAEAALTNEAYANVTGDERTALQVEIRKDEPTTAEAYVTATEALNAVTKAFVDAAVSYNALADANAMIVDLPYANAEKKPEAKTATNAEAAKTAAEEVLVSLRSYYESNALAEGVEGAENMTELIANPAAEEAIGETWTTTKGEGSGGTIDIKSNEPWTDASGNNTHKYFDGGNWGANAWDVTFSQNITLAAGKYLLSAITRASANVEQTLFAGETNAKTACVGSTGGVFNRGWNIHNVVFEVAEEGTVNIGVRGVTANLHEWMSFSDFRLVRLEKPATPDFEPAYGTLWTEADGHSVIDGDEPESYITLENKYFKGLAKVGDAIKVSISSVGNQPASSRPLIITKGTLKLIIDNAGEEQTIQQGTTSTNLILTEDEIAKIQEGADVVLSWKYLTVAQVELVEKKAEIDETLLAEAEQLASDESAVAVGKLLAAIETYKKDGIAETLQAAINQFKADNADQEADQTAKVATNGWKKYDGSNAGVCATQFAPAIDTYDGRKNVQLAEVYEQTVETTGTIIYQDITGLQNGTYKVGFYGNAFFTDGRGFTSPMADGAEDVAYVFANDQKAFITAHIATSTTENDFRQFDVEVTDGTIKLGMGKEQAGTNWHTMQIYQLTWFTTAKEVYAALKTDMQALIADAKAMTGVNEKEAFETALNKAEAALESNMLNITEFEAEITALKEAMKAFKLANLVIPEGKYYLSAIELEDNNIMAAGNAWGTHGIVNGEGLDLNFIYNYDADNYNIETNIYNGSDNHYLGSNLYMDAPAFGWKIEEATTGIGFNIYAMFDGVKKYISVASDGNLTLSETAYAWGFMHESNWVAIMEAALKEALEKATPENPVDATLLLKDANFNRNDHRWEAWTVSEDCTNKNLGGGCSGTNGNGCAESYHSTFTISQTINDAPKGTYELKVQGFYRQDGVVETGEVDPETGDPITEPLVEDVPVFFINDETKEVPVRTGEENSMSAASESFTAGSYNCEPITVFVENGTLTVGVQGTGVNQWVVFDNFRLTYYGSQNTVGITEVNTNVENNVKSIYNLNGQKVEKTGKGLYIINGKKVVLK